MNDDTSFSVHWIECGYDCSINRYYCNVNTLDNSNCNDFSHNDDDDNELIKTHHLYEVNQNFDQLYCFKFGDSIDLSFNIDENNDKKYLTFVKNGVLPLGCDYNFSGNNNNVNSYNSLSKAANELYKNAINKGKIELNDEFVYFPIFSSVGCNCQWNGKGYEFHARIE